MSKLPTFRGGKPQLNTSAQSTTTDPRTGTVKTTTRTNTTELRPSSSSAGICQPCDSGSSRIERPSGISQLRPPGSGIRRPQSISPQPQNVGMLSAESTRICAATLPRQRRAPPSAAPGQYAVRPQYAPQSARGKGMSYRGLMESRSPKPPQRYSEPAPKASQGPALETDPNELLNLSTADVAAVEQQVEQDLLQEYSTKPSRIYKKGKSIRKVAQDVIHTPAGIEKVIQQAYTEKRVERDSEQERVIKNVSVTNLGTRITLTEEEIDPSYALAEGRGKDVVTIKETVAVTKNYTTSAKNVSYTSIKDKVTIDPEELAEIVANENEDVETIVKMAPPEMTIKPERYGMKKRFQKLRLNSESMVAIEKTVVNPTSTADDAMMETPPEALVNIMHSVEEGGTTPQCAPEQVFHTLFKDKSPQHAVQLSSVGPGPLRDVVVPQEFTKDLHSEPMTSDLNRLTQKMKNMPKAEDVPYMDIFTRLMDDSAKQTFKKVPGTQKSFKPIGEEENPWGHEDIEPLVNIVGAEPIEVLNPINVEDLEESGKLQEELANGIEYFVDADPVQYVSKVQLRGSQHPSWFPGYMYALPEFPDVVKVARCPNEVLYASWKSVQPRLIPDQNISVLP